MNAPDAVLLPDVQASADERALPIQRVGVRGLRYPLVLRNSAGQLHSTVAEIEMTVSLAHDVKGTHMSRFVELLEAREEGLDFGAMDAVLEAMLERLEAAAGRIEMRFPYFIDKQAPVSGVSSLIDVDVTWIFEHSVEGRRTAVQQVEVPVTSLCPCSKKISAYGAHNQRSCITIRAWLDEVLAIEEMVRMAEEEASCEVFGLLKRSDEKWVTERAYDNPKFVEDLVRDIALRLRQESRIERWSVASENFESIHNHSAYALIEGANR